MTSCPRLHLHQSTSSGDLQTRTIPPSVRYYYHLVRRALRTKPGGISAVVLTFLVSEVSALIALLLPIKLVILLGSEKIPRYFPGFFSSFEREPLILLLSSLALAFYLLHLTFSRYSSHLVAGVSDYMLHLDTKILSTSRQRENAQLSIEEICRSLTGFVYAFLAIAILGFIYPLIFFFVVIFLFATSILIAVASKWKSSVRARIEQDFPTFVQGFVPVGFLSGFGLIVLDYLIPLDPPSLLYALIGLILLRQFLARLSAALGSASRLQKHKVILSQMLLSTGEPPNEIPDARKKYWELLEPVARKQWVQELDIKLPDSNSTLAKVTWLDTSFPGVANLIATWQTSDGGQFQLIIRLFNENSDQYAERENMVLSNNRGSFPSLPLLLKTSVGRFRCHVLKPPCVTNYKPPAGNLQSLKIEVMLLLSALPPPKTLVDSQIRMGQMLWQRLARLDLDRLQVLTGIHEVGHIPDIKHIMATASSIISELPLQLSKSRFPREDFLVDTSGKLYLLGWGDWCIEPIGAGWYSESNQLSSAMPQLLNAVQHRECAGTLSAEVIMLAAALYQFERLYLENRFVKALHALEEAYSLTEKIQKTSPKSPLIKRDQTEQN